jgi:DNA-binding LytR/AlgR family response regulator
MIVDDEPIAREILKKHIAATPGLLLLKSCINAMEAYEGLHQHAVDLLFLDIQMPVITGIDFLRSLRQPPLVVFTTAYHQYAVEGFELNSVDYLMKPITYDRFFQAVQKAEERRGLRTEKIAAPPADYLFIRQDSRLVKVPFDAIRYVEAEKDFSTVYLQDKKLLAGMHLKLFEDQLPADRFLRIHRSYMVNLSRITAVTGNLVELDRTELPIGAHYKEELMRRLGIAG